FHRKEFSLFVLHPSTLTPPRRLTLTIFPSTTLFRSCGRRHALLQHNEGLDLLAPQVLGNADDAGLFDLRMPAEALVHFARIDIRSEEHTSELQSPDHLVCRLLLEKKNNNTHDSQTGA